MAVLKLIHKYQPFGTAIELFNSRDAEIVYGGPAGTGKSRACLEKIHLLAMLNPGSRILMLRKTLVSLTSTGLVTYKEHVAKEHIASGEVKWYGGSPQEAAAYRYKNGSVLVVGGMDKAMKIMSSEYDIVYVQEATELTENDWEAITTRLRNGKISFQQLIADCNPDMPTHWLKVRCDKGQTKYIASRHEDNPTLYDPHTGLVTPAGASYMGKLDNLTGVRFDRLRRGIWSAAEGLVYETYDPNVNIYKHLPTPPVTWTRYLSIDFGYTNPFVCQWWAEDEDGRLYLYKELYATNGLVEDHAKTILANMGREREPKPSYVICDHDAEDRATLTRHLGMPTIAAKKTVSDGIQAVAARLKPSGDGKPRLYLCRDSLIRRDSLLDNDKKPCSTIEEIVGYIWDTKKDAPVKTNDHGMDAMRYMVAFKDLKSVSGVRTFNMGTSF